jgi:mitogen-activated protein kinase 1/3
LSSHVGSRWYRAPEISILENKYDSASDMWSFGCCIYELNKMLSKNPSNEKKSNVLFPGTSCYPLSPMVEKPTDDENMISDQDQMKVILRKIGKQDEHDLSFI